MCSKLKGAGKEKREMGRILIHIIEKGDSDDGTFETVGGQHILLRAFGRTSHGQVPSGVISINWKDCRALSVTK